METKKKHIKNFKEFFEDRKKVEDISTEKKIDWDDRKLKWINSVNEFYIIVDQLIVENFKNAGYSVFTQKEVVKNFEDFIGYYEIPNYIIKSENIDIKFFPIGTIVIGALGRLNMVLPKETIKVVLSDWGKWKIVNGYGSDTKLIDFNEQNIVRLFQENL